MELDAFGSTSGNLVPNAEIITGWKGSPTKDGMEVGPSSLQRRRRCCDGSHSRSGLMEGRSQGALELITAIFRLAVADYLGQSYSHDEWVPSKRVTSRYRTDASSFLSGAWARYLGDLVGLEGSALWREAQRLDHADYRQKHSAVAA